MMQYRMICEELGIVYWSNVVSMHRIVELTQALVFEHKHQSMDIN